MTQQDVNLLYQQVGEVLRGLRALSDSIELRHEQINKLHDLMRSDLTLLRQEQRDLEEKVNLVISGMQRDLEDIRSEACKGARSVDQLLQTMQDLRQPVIEIMMLRSRAAGLILGISVVGSVLMWLAEPIYRWFVEHHFLRQ